MEAERGRERLFWCVCRGVGEVSATFIFASENEQDFVGEKRKG